MGVNVCLILPINNPREEYLQRLMTGVLECESTLIKLLELLQFWMPNTITHHQLLVPEVADTDRMSPAKLPTIASVTTRSGLTIFMSKRQILFTHNARILHIKQYPALLCAIIAVALDVAIDVESDHIIITNDWSSAYNDFMRGTAVDIGHINKHATGVFPNDIPELANRVLAEDYDFYVVMNIC